MGSDPKTSFLSDVVIDEENENEDEIQMVGDLENQNFAEEVQNSEENYDIIGHQLLVQLDRDYRSSPRKLVRGVYKSDVLELVVRRKLQGNLVN